MSLSAISSSHRGGKLEQITEKHSWGSKLDFSSSLSAGKHSSSLVASKFAASLLN